MEWAGFLFKSKLRITVCCLAACVRNKPGMARVKEANQTTAILRLSMMPFQPLHVAVCGAAEAEPTTPPALALDARRRSNFYSRSRRRLENQHFCLGPTLIGLFLLHRRHSVLRFYGGSLITRLGFALVLMMFTIVLTPDLSLCCIIFIISSSGLPYIVIYFEEFLA